MGAKRPDHLRLHKKYKHEGISYTCEICAYSTYTQTSLKYHIEKHHGIPQVFRPQVKREIPKISGVEKTRERAEQTVHYCDVDSCSYSTNKKGNLKKHRENKHDIGYGIQKSETYHCDSCTYSNSNKG